MPMLVRWPGQVTAGTVSHEPVSSVDLLPTIAAATDVELPARGIDGVSLAEHLRSGGSRSLERQAIYWHFPHYRHPPGPYSIIRAGDWKLIRWYAGGHELYNLRDDLSETRDLAATHPEKCDELEKMLTAELARVKAKLPRANPAYREKPAK